MSHVGEIALIATGLGELVESVAFVGGAVIGLYVDDPGAPRPRFTDDVDCVVEISGFGEYAQLEERLRGQKFNPDTSPGAPLCRWIFRGVRVDVMPTDASILGFTNSWYREGMQHRRPLRVSDEVAVHGFTIPYLVATKLEAFRNRGQGDWLGSHDVEDIIALFDGARTAFDELMVSTGSLREFLNRELGALVRHGDFYEIVLGHVRPGTLSAVAAQRIVDRLARFVDTSSTSSAK